MTVAMEYSQERERNGISCKGLFQLCFILSKKHI